MVLELLLLGLDGCWFMLDLLETILILCLQLEYEISFFIIMNLHSNT